MNAHKTLKTAVIGCGKGGEGIGGHSIGYRHAQVYQHLGYELAGACDLNEENLKGFAEHFSVPHASVDLDTMLQGACPDLVSICTYAGSHLSILKQCAAAGVKRVFMEKPMCLSLQDGEEMLQVADSAEMKIVVNHYRRYLPRFMETKAKLDAGVIGTPLLYVAGIDGWDLMEWGTHWLDMFRFFANDQEVTWMMGQAAVSDKQGYGHVMEDHALAYFGFADGSKALLDGGSGFPGDMAMRIIGTEGLLEIPDFDPVVTLNTSGREEFAAGTNIHYDDQDQAWQMLLRELEAWCAGGEEPQCGLRNALKSSELYLAAYESAMQGGKVEFPYDPAGKGFPLRSRNS
jgi:predicted dehydrogenase